MMQLLTLNNALALLAFIAIWISLWGNLKTKDKEVKRKNYATMAVSLVIMILSFVNNCIETTADELSDRRANTIQTTLEKLNVSDSVLKQKINILDTVKASLDLIGIKLNEATGNVSIEDKEKLKRVILTKKSGTNVLSVNQQGGQTARDIINN